MRKRLTIGNLAKAADVNIETIRYYQRIGLLTEPQKPAEGYRVYPEKSITRLGFIKQAKKLGFNLKEVAELLQLGDGQCGDVRARAEQKRLQINKQIKDLKKLRNTLDDLIDSCKKDADTACCPIVESLIKI
ncbi:hypothetical protein MNBD_GAMMA08-413 [hydrothermal vent metagenome]|uniref:Mercuric resistance operon regulatory protein n=1 Tax=hydrothermal vent metagenome TaxID=652676 RepID=A0A3B0XI32_9ZZZZ